jgi:hypothetical protein
MVRTGVETVSNMKTENTHNTEQAENKILLRICELAGMGEVEKEWEAVLKVLEGKLAKVERLERTLAAIETEDASGKRWPASFMESDGHNKRQCCALQRCESTEEQ